MPIIETLIEASLIKRKFLYTFITIKLNRSRIKQRNQSSYIPGWPYKTVSWTGAQHPNLLPILIPRHPLRHGNHRHQRRTKQIVSITHFHPDRFLPGSDFIQIWSPPYDPLDFLRCPVIFNLAAYAQNDLQCRYQNGYTISYPSFGCEQAQKEKTVKTAFPVFSSSCQNLVTDRRYIMISATISFNNLEKRPENT